MFVLSCSLDFVNASCVRWSTLLATLALLALAPTAVAEDWPGWRGPRHDGISRDAAPPTRWSAKTNVSWKVPTPGIGHSSPVVTGDRVVLTTCVPENDAQLLVCYERAAGSELWRETVATSPIEPMHPQNSPASSTPVTNGNVIVTTFAINGGYFVTGFDMDGKRLWERRLASFISRHGFHSCPILYHDSILLSGLQDSDESFVARLNIETGEIEWLTNTETSIRSFSPPHVTRFEGEDIIVVSGASCTTAFDLQSGRQLWRLPGPAEKTVSSIVEADGRLFVAGGREKKLLAIDLTHDDPTQPVWTSSAGVPYISSPIIVEGALHQVSDDGIYTQIDPMSGDTLERHRLLGPTSASPIWADGKLFLTDEAGLTIVATLSPELTVIAENSIDEPVFASLAVSEQDLFIRSDRHLFCIRKSQKNVDSE